MHDEADPARPPRSWLSGGRGLVLLAAAALAPSLAAAGLWLLADSHRILPGLGGCQYVRDRAAQLNCYSSQFGARVREDGREAALRSIDREAVGNLTLGADCHLAWHPVGELRGAADARRDRGYANITADTTCQQGYAHGYSIGYMSVADPTISELAQIIGDECGASSGLNALFNCTHAYGHVIARQVDGNAEAGVSACAQVDFAKLPGATVASPVPGEEPPVRTGVEHQCLYGMYMEVSLLDVAKGVTTLDNCGTATTRAARKACYAYLPARVNAIEGDLDAAGRACHELAPRGEPRDSCVKTFSIGLPDSSRCSYLVSAPERAQCARVIRIRDQQDDLLEFASGDPDSFDANVRIAPEPGVTVPQSAPIPPADGPPPS